MEHIEFIYNKLREINNYIHYNNVNLELLHDYNLEKYRDGDSITDLLYHDKTDPPNIYNIIDDNITPLSGSIDKYYIDINNTSIKSILCLVGIVSFGRNDILEIICDKLGESTGNIKFQTFTNAHILSTDKLENMQFTNCNKWVIVNNQMIAVIDKWKNNKNILLRIKIVVDDDIKYYLIDDTNERDAKCIGFTEEALDQFIKHTL